MTREEYFRFSLGRDPYGASEKPRETGPVVIQGLSGPVEVGNPFNPMHLIRGVGDMFMGALQDMGNIGDTSFHSPPTKQQPSAIGDTIDTAKAIKDDPVGVGKALIDSMMPYSKGAFANVGTAVAGPKVMPKVVSGAKTGAQAVKKGADSAIDWMKPTHGNIGKDMSRRELMKSSSSAALPILTKRGKGPLSSNKATGGMSKKQPLIELQAAIKGVDEHNATMLALQSQSDHIFRQLLDAPEGTPMYKELDSQLAFITEAMQDHGRPFGGANQIHLLYEQVHDLAKKAGESGMLSPDEVRNIVHPAYIDAQQFLGREAKRNARDKASMDKFIAEKPWEKHFGPESQRNHPEPNALPNFNRPIMPDHGRTINFMTPIE